MNIIYVGTTVFFLTVRAGLAAGAEEDAVLAQGQVAPRPAAVEIGLPRDVQRQAWDARIVEYAGRVLVRFKGDPEWRWRKLTGNIPLEMGDSLRTGPASHALIALSGKGILHLKENSFLKLADLRRPRSLFDLREGTLLMKILSLISLGLEMEVETRSAVASVRGTEFGVSVLARDLTAVSVYYKGRLEVSGRPADKPSGRLGQVFLDPWRETLVRYGHPPAVPRNLQTMKDHKEDIRRLDSKLEASKLDWKPMTSQERRSLRQRLAPPDPEAEEEERRRSGAEPALDDPKDKRRGGVREGDATEEDEDSEEASRFTKDRKEIDRRGRGSRRDSEAAQARTGGGGGLGGRGRTGGGGGGPGGRSLTGGAAGLSRGLPGDRKPLPDRLAVEPPAARAVLPRPDRNLPGREPPAGGPSLGGGGGGGRPGTSYPGSDGRPGAQDPGGKSGTPGPAGQPGGPSATTLGIGPDSSPTGLSGNLPGTLPPAPPGLDRPPFGGLGPARPGEQGSRGPGPTKTPPGQDGRQGSNSDQGPKLDPIELKSYDDPQSMIENGKAEHERQYQQYEQDLRKALEEADGDQKKKIEEALRKVEEGRQHKSKARRYSGQSKGKPPPQTD